MRRLWLLLALASCAPPTAVAYGEQLFTDSAFSGSKFNTWSCSSCHATKDSDTRMLPGHPLEGVVGRPSYWGGTTLRLIDASSFCYVYFMRGPKALDPADVRARALYEYLKSLGETGDAKPYSVVANVADVPRGDSARGAKVYESACKSCHGAVHTGAGRNPERASILPEVKDAYGSLFPGVAPAVVFVEKVRHGQFFGVGGSMPLFGKEQLTDEDLGALLQYLEL